MRTPHQRQQSAVSNPMIRLSVNVNKVATLRNSRGGARAERARRRRRLRRRPARRASPCIRAPTAPHHAGRCARRSRSALQRARRGVEFNIEGDPRPDLLDARARGAAGSVHAGAGRRRARSPARRAGSRSADATALADDRSGRCSAAAFASACSSIPSAEPIRLGGVGSAPIASSSTPSRSPARSSRAPDAGAALVRALRRGGRAGARARASASMPATISISTISCSSGRCRISTKCRSATRSCRARCSSAWRRSSANTSRCSDAWRSAVAMIEIRP